MRKMARPYWTLLLSVLAGVLARRALGRQPAFRGEFVMEDLILLLTVAMGLAPSRFKPLFSLVIIGAMGVTIALLTWAASRALPLAEAILCYVSFAVLAVCIGLRAVRDLSEFRKYGATQV